MSILRRAVFAAFATAALGLTGCGSTNPPFPTQSWFTFGTEIVLRVTPDAEREPAAEEVSRVADVWRGLDVALASDATSRSLLQSKLTDAAPLEVRHSSQISPLRPAPGTAVLCFADVPMSEDPTPTATALLGEDRRAIECRRMVAIGYAVAIQVAAQRSARELDLDRILTEAAADLLERQLPGWSVQR